MEERQQTMNYEEEREIDLKQLFLVILMRWRILLLCGMLGVAAGVAATWMRTAQSAQKTVQTASGTNAENEDLNISEYLKEKEYYDRMQALYTQWIDEAQTVLEAGLPETMPEGTTEIDETQAALEILDWIVTIKKARDDMREPSMPSQHIIIQTGEQSEGIDTVIVNENPAAMLSRIIKGAVIGCLGGLLAGFMLLAMYYIFAGKVLSADEFNKRYGLRALTVFPAAGLRGVGLKCARAGRDGAYYRMTPVEQVEVACANISVYAPEVKELLLIGSVNGAKLEEVRKAFSERLKDVSLSCASDINENALSLQALKDHDHVILVEQMLSSRYEIIDRELKTLIDWKKDIVGSVVVG